MKTHVVKHKKENCTHAHTVAVVTHDLMGNYWLEIRCRKRDCKGNTRISLVSEQIAAWEQKGEIFKSELSLSVL